MLWNRGPQVEGGQAEIALGLRMKGEENRQDLRFGMKGKENDIEEYNESEKVRSGEREKNVNENE